MEQKNTRKPARRYGPRAVLVAIFLVAIAAGLAVLRYVYEQPTSKEAHLLFQGKVLATMEPRTSAKVQEGMPATVTIDGYDQQKFAGVVQMVDTSSEKETLLMIRLKNPPDDATPPLACTVQIDLTNPHRP